MSDMTAGHLAGPDLSAPSRRNDPVVRTVTVDDISLALAAGLRDFRAAPMFGLVFAGFYVVGGILLTLVSMELDLVFLAYPLAAGFAIVAPLVAVGLYEVSRLLERGETPTWSAVLAAVPHHGARELGYMALVAVFGLIVWVYSAGFLYAVFFGLHGFEFSQIVSTVVSTPRGIAFFLLGNVVGAVIALGLFSVSVVSYPMLLDREVDFVTAMITSIRVVLANPGPMIGWGIFIGTLLGVAILPGFIGLFVVLPMLGHATWHVYRKAVAP
ncbi:DUF2189 domain-containing protein [Prosthecomicrobium hirschii]|uniref:DUF2189 domain-containing protein n=1 Tax=Prosthecodimorpha hirschii TaxID=665126 RepID=UPI001FEEB0EE|nr:DUF2189 domain-containing protein [Prosthecomicrobium hirschii]MCW1840872.1 DUF2189 domain-containing protein [Prosthecomicrobium hirschii]